MEIFVYHVQMVIIMITQEFVINVMILECLAVKDQMLNTALAVFHQATLEQILLLLQYAVMNIAEHGMTLF